jgi:hypothetical protein
MERCRFFSLVALEGAQNISPAGKDVVCIPFVSGRILADAMSVCLFGPLPSQFIVSHNSCFSFYST